MNITTKPVEYMDGDQKCLGYLAWDESVASSRPCVLVGHAWGGRDSFAEDKAIQMAALGYVGFAMDIYGDHYQPESVDDKMKAMTALTSNRAALLSRIKAGMQAASELEQVDRQAMAMIGYCFGGLCTLDLARSGADIKAAISFHGLLGAPELPKNKITSKVLVNHGWNDPMVPPDDVTALVTELDEAGCDYQILGFGQTGHAFTVPEANDVENGAFYNASSTERSWNAAQSLLSEVFSMHGVV